MGCCREVEDWNPTAARSFRQLIVSTGGETPPELAGEDARVTAIFKKTPWQGRAPSDRNLARPGLP